MGVYGPVRGGLAGPLFCRPAMLEFGGGLGFGLGRFELDGGKLDDERDLVVAQDISGALLDDRQHVGRRLDDRRAACKPSGAAGAA